MVMPFSVLFSVFGMGIALMGLQIRLSGQVRDQIRGVHGEVKDLSGRIERVEERLSGEIKAVRIELNGRIDQVRDELNGRIDQVRDELNGRIDQVSGELKEVRGEVTFIKGHLSAVLAFRLPKAIETP